MQRRAFDQLDVMVPDVEATTKFYISLFNTELQAQEWRGSCRQFVLLNRLTESREVAARSLLNMPLTYIQTMDTAKRTAVESIASEVARIAQFGIDCASASRPEYAMTMDSDIVFS